MARDEEAGISKSIVVSEDARRRGRPRLFVLVVAVLGMLAMVGGAAGIYLYDKSTEIDRSTPTASARQFLTAVLVEEDLSRVELFTCANWDASAAASAVKALGYSEADLSWDLVTVAQQTGSEAEVHVRMLYQFHGDLYPSGQETWRIHLRETDGWRVCSVEKEV